jgi:hypothetical protein
MLGIYHLYTQYIFYVLSIYFCKYTSIEDEKSTLSDPTVTKPPGTQSQDQDADQEMLAGDLEVWLANSSGKVKHKTKQNAKRKKNNLPSHWELYPRGSPSLRNQVTCKPAQH